MHFRINWYISIGSYSLAILDSVEIHKSVDLLADTCTIKIPATAYNKPLPQNSSNELGDNISGKIKRGDLVKVFLAYNLPNDDWSKVKPEFEGYLLNINTDDGSIILNCEDDLFLMRVAVKDKQFKSTSIKEIAQYLISETKCGLKLNCSLNILYDKFVISKATAYDVLKKLQEETKGNIYIKKNTDGTGVLNIHPPYTEKHGYVDYSFQENIEKSDLKYKNASDKKLLIEVENTGKDGKKVVVTSGTTGGDKVTITGYGLSKSSMQILADAEYRRRQYDGFEGSITTWLIPYCEPGYTCTLTDEDYQYKNGSYYTPSVTTSLDGSGGGVRKIQMGIKVGSNG